MMVWYSTMEPKEFPYGLRCAMCSREILPGQPYTDTMDGMIGEAASTILICVYC